MLEKVNKWHPDKVADRIAGAIVDYAYTKDDRPKIAVEVLVGHGTATVIAETSVTLDDKVVAGIVERITGIPAVNFIQVPQDPHLSRNQNEKIRCGDNGVFTAKWNNDYETATTLARSLGEQFPTDGKYLFDLSAEAATICQSNASAEAIKASLVLADFKQLVINPLGEWTGGTDTDTGCTNRKLGNDQPYCNPNGLHGKDLSKADVSVSIYINAVSRVNGGVFVKAHCSIGDSEVVVEVEGRDPQRIRFADIVNFSRDYVKKLGGFEAFAEYGLLW
jgi:S-adenosylmethionine synthetase